jgi:hypothetical protein
VALAPSSVPPPGGLVASDTPYVVTGPCISPPFAIDTAYPGTLARTPKLSLYVSVPSSPPKEVSEWSKPATYTSIIALIVSVSVVFYTYFKDSRARKHSVEDDYWLRKVVGPIAIEPLLKDILEMISAAPDDSSSATFSSQLVDDFHKLYLGKLSALAVASASLQIIDKDLATGTASAIDQIQDLMIDYCFENKASHAVGKIATGKEKATFQAGAKDMLIALLKPIREFQVKKVGK